MKHADRLMERILMLDGLPNLQDLGKLLIGENVPEVLECDLQSKRGAQATLTASAAAPDGRQPRRPGRRYRPARSARLRWT